VTTTSTPSQDTASAMDTTLSVNSFDDDADFDGISGQVGFNWKWGK